MSTIHNARKFKLAIYNGITPIKFFDLSADRGDKNCPLLYKPFGLGFSLKNSYSRVSNGFYANTQTDLVQNKIACHLVFKPNNGLSAYRVCTNFIGELVKGQTVNELYLGYYTPNNTSGNSGQWMWFQCELTKYSKTEYANDSADMLDVDAEFTALTPATRGTENGAFIKTVTFDAIGSNTTYDTVYNYEYSKSGAVDIVLPATESAEILSGFSFYYKADTLPLENPVFTIKNTSTGDTIGIVKYNGEINLGSVFEFYSTPNKAICTVDGVDVIDNIELSSMPFFDIPPFTKTTITVEASGTFGEITVSIYPYSITL